MSTSSGHPAFGGGRRGPAGSARSGSAVTRWVPRGETTTAGGSPTFGGGEMAEQLQSAIDASTEKTNLILQDIEEAVGWPKGQRNQSYCALRTMLHLLRDRLPVQESVEFAAQLPLVVRGIYFDGWQPMDVPVKLNRDDFLLEFRKQFTYDLQGDAAHLVQVVLDVLRRHVSSGQWDDVKDNMPKDLAQMMP